MLPPPSLPVNPGCYLFKSADGEIIYIGKAKNLKKRVSSYFQRPAPDPKTLALVENITSMDFIVTENEVESLILENNLIKQHQPKYNIDLRDSKSFAHIQLSDDEFPRIGIARRPTGGGQLFGPFVSAAERDHLLALIKRTFRLRTCRRLTKRSCLRFHMGSCMGPCAGRITAEEYRKEVQKATALLKGKTPELVESLREEMARWSSCQEFEKALQVRNQITAIEHLAQKQHVERPNGHDEAVIAWLPEGVKVHLIVFSVHRGRFEEKEAFTFNMSEGFFEEFLVQYYGERVPPEELVVPEPIDEALVEYLSRRRGRQVKVTVPQRGEKKALLDLALKNIEIAQFGDRRKTEALRRVLHLTEPPEVIECFDISHTGGTGTVGSMVQFRNGKPDKKNYRRFRIRSVEGIDDPAAIAEVVRRRYGRLVDEDDKLPDLIIVDGGKAQLGAASEELQKLGVTIPVIAIAKREEEIFELGDSEPLRLKRKDTGLLYIREIRDEAHRFAVAYHRLLRRKKMKEEE